LFAGIKNKNHIRGKTKKDTRKKDEIEENVKLKKNRLIIAIHRHLHPTTECKMKRL